MPVGRIGALCQWSSSGRRAGVQPARCHAFGPLQVLTELAAVDAQIGFEDVIDRQSSVLVELLGYRGPYRLLTAATQRQRAGILAIANCSTSVSSASTLACSPGSFLWYQLLLRKSQHRLVRDIDAGLPVGRSGLRSKLRICESRMTRLKSTDDPLELVDQHRSARRAVAFTEMYLGEFQREYFDRNCEMNSENA